MTQILETIGTHVVAGVVGLAGAMRLAGSRAMQHSERLIKAQAERIDTIEKKADDCQQDRESIRAQLSALEAEVRVTRMRVAEVNSRPLPPIEQRP